MEDKFFIPFSEGEYYLDIDNRLFYSNGDYVKIENINNSLKVKLNFYGEEEIHDLVIVIIVTRFNVKLPKRLWCEIKPLFRNGNNNDYSQENLTYTFKTKPLKVESKQGFYYIPFYTDYCVDIDGNLYSFKRKEITKWGVSSPCVKNNRIGGYFCGRVRKDFDNLSHSSRHRILGLAFIDYDSSINELVINHKNGIPGDDRINNLEFITKRENNQHAYNLGLVNRTRKIIVKNILTEEEISFPSIAECSRFLNKSEGYVFARLNKFKRYSDNLLFKINDDKPWPEVLFKLIKCPVERSVVSKNIFTNEVVIFNNFTEASEYIKTMSRASISNHCNAKIIIPIKGYNFRFIDEFETLPKFTQEHIELLKTDSNSKLIKKRIMKDLTETQ